MTRMLFGCMVALVAMPTLAIPVCHPTFEREPPGIDGKDYATARSALIDDGWFPLTLSPGRFPEVESCTQQPTPTCDLVFRDATHTYSLVIEAKTDPLANGSGLRVTRHYFRCNR